MVEIVRTRKLYERDFVAWCDDGVARHFKAKLI